MASVSVNNNQRLLEYIPSDYNRLDIINNNPTAEWEKMANKQIVKSITDLNQLLIGPSVNNNSLPPLSERNYIRCVAISDTHTFHNNYINPIPAGDILIHTGDFTSRGRPAEISSFNKFLRSQPHQYKIFIAGNHDISLDNDSYHRQWKRFRHPEQYNTDELKALLVSGLPIDRSYYLDNSSCEVLGYKFYGSPITPAFYDWAFNRDRGPDIRQYWNKIPTDTEILLTHGPAIGHGDLCISAVRAGCVDLLLTIQQRLVQLKYHIFGHIHEGAGVTTDNRITYINCSSCNVHYNKHQLNPPIVFDLPKKQNNNNISNSTSTATATAAAASASDTNTNTNNSSVNNITSSFIKLKM